MQEERKTILLAEDDVSLGYLLVENLQGKGFSVELAKTGTETMRALRKQKFSLCLLDVMIPEVDGFTIAVFLKQQHPGTPFIFLTARNMEQDKLRGFETGADDYITKPFSFKELYCRILVALRRGSAHLHTPEHHMLSLDNVALYPGERMLEISGIRKKLSQRETAILQLLMMQNGSYVSRTEILKRIWGNDDYFTAKSMDVYLTRIRKLLKEAPAVELENLYGTGYRIKAV